MSGSAKKLMAEAYKQFSYLVSNEHYDDIGFRVVPQLLEPPLHVLEGHLLGNVVHQQRANCTSVQQVEGWDTTVSDRFYYHRHSARPVPGTTPISPVIRTGNRSVSLLARCVPNLSCSQRKVNMKLVRNMC